MDEKRMESLTEIESALRRDAPIDKYLADIEHTSRQPVDNAEHIAERTLSKHKKPGRRVSHSNTSTCMPTGPALNVCVIHFSCSQTNTCGNIGMNW